MYGCVHCMRIVCKFVCLFLCMNVHIYTSINRNKLATIFGWLGFLVIKKAVSSTKRAVSSIKRALFPAKRARFINNTFLATVSDRAGLSIKRALSSAKTSFFYQQDEPGHRLQESAWFLVFIGVGGSFSIKRALSSAKTALFSAKSHILSTRWTTAFSSMRSFVHQKSPLYYQKSHTRHSWLPSSVEWAVSCLSKEPNLLPKEPYCINKTYLATDFCRVGGLLSINRAPSSAKRAQSSAKRAIFYRQDVPGHRLL